ncbi:MAG: hypothetical protein AAFV53_37440 [Myxococcota bacterium]
MLSEFPLSLALGRCLEGVNNSVREEEVLFGAGLAAVSQPRDPEEVAKLRASVGEDVFTRGLGAGAAGMKVPVRLQTYLHWKDSWLR